ncbi:hypothetical protein IBX65_02855 [Candidatus Aerophobetes bacterium]|nr:hypothetical protein [Candidatus Aerophobetes bacterium]
MRIAASLLVSVIVIALVTSLVFPGRSTCSAVSPQVGPQLLSQEKSAESTGKMPFFNIESISHSWGPASPDKTTIITRIILDDKDLSEVALSVFCSIYLNDVKMCEVEVDEPVVEKTAAGTLIRFISQIDNNDESINEWWFSHIKNGEKTTARMQGKLKISSGDETFFYPFLWENEFQTNILEGVNVEDVRTINFGLYRLEIESLHSEWGEITPDETEIKHTLRIHNPSVLPGAPIVNRVEYELSLNEIKMTEGEMGLPLFIWSGETKIVSFTSELDSEKIKKWWVSHIKFDEKSSYLLRYTLFVKVLGATLARWPEDNRGAFATDFLGRKGS